MSNHTAIIGQVSGGAQENPSHVHELAEGEISNKYTHKKKMDVKDAFIKYKFEILFKDGKYKYTLYKFIVPKGSQAYPIEKWMNPNHATPEEGKARYTQLDEKIEKVISDFKFGMKKPAETKTDDW